MASVRLPGLVPLRLALTDSARTGVVVAVPGPLPEAGLVLDADA